MINIEVVKLLIKESKTCFLSNHADEKLSDVNFITAKKVYIFKAINFTNYLVIKNIRTELIEDAIIGIKVTHEKNHYNNNNFPNVFWGQHMSYYSGVYFITNNNKRIQIYFKK